MCNENIDAKNEDIKPSNEVDNKQETKPVVRLETMDRIGLVGVIAAAILGGYAAWTSKSKD